MFETGFDQHEAAAADTYHQNCTLVKNFRVFFYNFAIFKIAAEFPFFLIGRQLRKRHDVVFSSNENFKVLFETRSPWWDFVCSALFRKRNFLWRRQIGKKQKY